MQVTNTGVITIPITAAQLALIGSNVPACRRVVIDNTNGIALAGASDIEIGTLNETLVVAGLGKSKGASIVTPNNRDTIKMVAAGPITQYATVYAAANGKIDDSANSYPIGIALSAAGADGDYVEVLRQQFVTVNGAAGKVTARTTDKTLTAAELNQTWTNTGATGTVVFNLPAATVGMIVTFVVGAAYELRINPDGTETLSLPSNGVPGGAGKYLTANAVGESIVLHCAITGSWSVLGFTGTWTSE